MKQLYFFILVFLFYFGLKAGKTGLNKFIQYFGDKGVFKTAE